MLTVEASLIDLIPAHINTNELLNLINSRAITSKSLLVLKSLTNFRDEVIANWLNINVKTFRSYKSVDIPIKEDLQEHTILLIALMKHGMDVFGNQENFSRWLETENFYLGKKKPMGYLNTISGIQFIDSRLTAMEYGDNV